MSLEALSALKQLTEVRQTGLDVQQNNLEKVQGEVQKQGTSEASRVDNLSLEKIKAEYEGALHAAQIERLQQQLARETQGVVVAAVIAIGVTAVGALDLAITTGKDIYHAAKGGGQFGKDADQKDKVNDIKDPKNARQFGSGNQTFVEGKDKNGNTVVYGAKKGPGGKEVTEVGAANITDDDIKKEADKLDPNKVISTEDAEKQGLIKDGVVTKLGESVGFDKEKGTIDPTKIKSFEQLNAVDPKAAKALFSSKEHDIKMSESDGMNTAFSKAKGADKSLAEGVEKKLDRDGKSVSGLEKAGMVGKNFFDGVIRLAEAAVPFFQAYMAAKDKAANTAEELQMAIEKQAANMKKLKKLEELMVNAGAGGMGKL